MSDTLRIASRRIEMPKESDDWVVFKDKNGNNWTRGNIKELIEGYRCFRRFLEVFNHYKDRF